MSDLKRCSQSSANNYDGIVNTAVFIEYNIPIKQWLPVPEELTIFLFSDSNRGRQYRYTDKSESVLIISLVKLIQPERRIILIDASANREGCD